MNKDLQATHQIIHIFESSKLRTEELLDYLPLVFAMVDQDGTILRGNINLAKLLNLEIEQLLGMQLRTLFADEEWGLFRKYLGECSEDGQGQEFKLRTLKSQGKEPQFLQYLWNISPVGLNETDKSTKFWIIGKDVTELEKALLKLNSATKDLEVSAAVQSMLIPAERTLQSENINLVSTYQAATKSGGDWMWYHLREDKTVSIVLADVTGHGAGSAMVTAIIAGSYHTLLKVQSKGSGVSSRRDEVRRTFDVLNKNIAGLCKEYWMTMSALEIFPDEDRIEFWNAGAPNAYHIKPNGEIKAISATGTPLGSEEYQVGYVTCEFKKGDRVLLYTDGLTECVLPTGEMLGRRGLQKLLAQVRTFSIEQVMNHLVQNSIGVTSEHPRADDISMVLVERL